MRQLPAGATINLDDFPPRAWTDIEIPTFPERVNKREYYVKWLTDHLFKPAPTVHPRQKEFLDHLHLPFLDYWAEYFPEGLGIAYAEMLSSFEIVEASHEAGETWSQFDTRQFTEWKKEMSGYDTEWQCSYDTEWRGSEGSWRKIGEEWAEKQVAGSFPEYPDIPYRTFLSLEIKDLSEPEKRDVIEGYLDAFGEIFPGVEI